MTQALTTRVYVADVAATFYSRGKRDERTDLLEVHDTVNLAPQYEVVLPPHRTCVRVAPPSLRTLHMHMQLRKVGRAQRQASRSMITAGPTLKNQLRPCMAGNNALL